MPPPVVSMSPGAEAATAMAEPERSRNSKPVAPVSCRPAATFTTVKAEEVPTVPVPAEPDSFCSMSRSYRAMEASSRSTSACSRWSSLASTSERI